MYAQENNSDKMFSPSKFFDIWYSSLDNHLEKYYSDISYSTCFLNYEVNHFKKCEFSKIIVQGTTVPNIKIRECLVFSTKEPKGQKSKSCLKFQFY